MIVLGLSAAAVALDEADRPWLAGLCLALCSIKFHLFVFTPVALLLHRKWRFAAAAALGVALELAASFAVAGWRWPLRIRGIPAQSRAASGTVCFAEHFRYRRG